MNRRPKCILVENVIGFEASESRRRLLAVVAELGWEVAELDLRPEDFGLPNSRPRYYGLLRSPDVEESGYGLLRGCLKADMVADGDAPARKICAPQWRLARDALEDDSSASQGHALLQRLRPRCAEFDCPSLGTFLKSAEGIEQEEVELRASLEVPQGVISSHVASGGRYDLHL